MRAQRSFSSRFVLGGLILGVPLLLVAQEPVDPQKPVWAYAITPEMPVADVRGPQPRQPQNGRVTQAGARRGGGAPPDTNLYSVPGSKFQFTMAQIRSTADPVDWFPDEHPPVPEIVKLGRPPVVKPCWSCHTLNGKGKPENGPIAGLPKDYLIRQLREFKSGVRDTADIHKPKDMRGITQGMSEEDMEQAADYFAAMPWTPWIHVIEADVIPKVRMAGQAFHLVNDGTTEPIGARIVEANEDEEQERLRSPHAGWVAYVPVGAIKKGEALVTTGGGKTVPCITCHGQDLKGVGTIPGIAGRGPSYLARQLYDFQQGTRNGEFAPLMKAVAEKLTNEDMINILAYISSRKP
jgi:cytochrome c553